MSDESVVSPVSGRCTRAGLSSRRSGTGEGNHCAGLSKYWPAQAARAAQAPRVAGLRGVSSRRYSVDELNAELHPLRTIDLSKSGPTPNSDASSSL